MREWVLLHYRVPSVPSARRVYVWRNLKQLGAMLLHDSVWVLPYTAWTYEQLQWLAAEVEELEGEAMLWRAQLILPGQEEALVARFVAASEAEYAPLRDALAAEEPDLADVSRRFLQVRRRDYFDCATGKKIYEILSAAREE